MTQLRYALVSCRRVGQTTALVGVLLREDDAVLIVSDRNYAKQICHQFILNDDQRRRVITLDDVDHALRGRSCLMLWDNSAISRYEHMMGRNAARYEKIVKLAQRWLCLHWTGTRFLMDIPIGYIIMKLARKWELVPKVTPGYHWGKAPRGARK